MMNGWNDGWSGGSWVAMTLGMLVVWGLVAIAIVAIVRSSHRGPHPTADGTDRARQILDERFAHGDIDAEEYAHRRDLLHGR